jgi:hypothetical protein
MSWLFHRPTPSEDPAGRLTTEPWRHNGIPLHEWKRGAAQFLLMPGRTHHSTLDHATTLETFPPARTAGRIQVAGPCAPKWIARALTAAEAACKVHMFGTLGLADDLCYPCFSHSLRRRPAVSHLGTSNAVPDQEPGLATRQASFRGVRFTCNSNEGDGSAGQLRHISNRDSCDWRNALICGEVTLAAIALTWPIAETGDLP